MEAIRFNADYESMLFHRRPGPPILNHSLEFLAFFLEEAPLFTLKTYEEEYLDHVREITGRSPRTVTKGNYSNWWGPLSDLELEKYLNSKLTSTELVLTHDWEKDIYIIKSHEELKQVIWDRPFLAKDPYGMSGRGLKKLSSIEEAISLDFPCILEPLLERIRDFSHYIFQDGSSICYQNCIDRNFQYRGSIFNNYCAPFLENLSFYAQVSAAEWSLYKARLELIVTHFKKGLHLSGFSVDSFVHSVSGCQLKALSEVNYRKTMGSVTYGLAQKYGKQRPWCMLVLGKTQTSFKEINDKLSILKLLPASEEGILHLSPSGVRYQFFFLNAQGPEQGKRLFGELKKLLPDCQFAIEI